MKDELSILTLGAAKSAGGGGGTGDGDMKKAVYDSNDDGIVDAADNAAKVGGHTVATDVPANAVFTDTVYDDTSISNRVSAIEEVVPSDATTSNKLATQSDLPSAVTGNPEGSATAGNLTKLQIGSDIYDVPSGGGNTVSKTRYQISSSSWSSSANSDGYYTLTATLNPAIGSSPDVYVAGSADGTQPTDTEKGQFAYVKRCKVNGSTLTLYASSKPSSTFYIWVEGVNGTGSGDIVGNVIQPNGSEGGSSLSDFTAIPIYNNRATRVSGGYYVEGNKVFIQETVDVESGLFTGTSELWGSIFNIPQNFPIPIRTAIPLKAELWVGNFMVGQSTVVYDSSARIKKYSSDDTYIEVRFPADIIPTPSDLHLTILGEYYYQ